ncbi:hypothetical protein CVIRNUC_008457 [Coccomyxa viridis]|uniref:Rab5-interacting protein n=1 Tax=Coccomyxa viridis TaxID=1274662 RepID=A0AAV1ID11_9CHLO|nr:hypothetical protein CVIRNUC_008457 [Coccomyxa viridis]
MVSPAKQLQKSSSSANEQAEGLMKDHRVKGPGPRLLLLFRKASSHTGAPWDKEDLLDVLHWMRQLLAVVAGCVWGVLPLTGLYAFLGFLALCLLLPYLWYQSQRIDEEEFGGHQALAGEGLAPALASFVLVWIIAYTFSHYHQW